MAGISAMKVYSLVSDRTTKIRTADTSVVHHTLQERLYSAIREIMLCASSKCLWTDKES